MLWWQELIIWVVGVIVVSLILKRMIGGPYNSYHPSLEGKVVIVTGANAGVGFNSAEELAQLNPRVLIMACRNQQRGEDAVARVKANPKASQANVIYMNLDLGDMESVKSFSQEIINTYDKVDILLCNAGLTGSLVRTTQKQGFENTLGVNHLGHFLLTQNLLPLLKKSQDARIVNVASAAYYFSKLTLDDLQLEKDYASYPAYSNSKYMQVLSCKELARRLELDGVMNVKVVSLHPGTVRTEVNANMFQTKAARNCFLAVFSPCIFVFTKSPIHGAQTSLHCCLADKDKLQNGAYYENCGQTKLNLKDGHQSLTTGVWEFTEEATKPYLI